VANNLLILIGAAAGAYYLFKDKENTECRDGFKWDPELRACVQIPVPPVPPVNCPEGFRYDAESNSCVAIEGGETVPPQCEEGFRYNADTGACEQIPAPPEPTCKVDSLAPVLAGQRLLKIGCKGNAVKELQIALVHWWELDLCKRYGTGGKFEDGIFGPNTRKALEGFQQASGLTRDGILGQKSLNYLKAYFDNKQHSYGNAPDELAGDARVIRNFQDARAPVTGGVCSLYD